jgi:hypothetical protein
VARYTVERAIENSSSSSLMVCLPAAYNATRLELGDHGQHAEQQSPDRFGWDRAPTRRGWA